MTVEELAPPSLPLSREVRLAHGVTHGAMEQQIHRAAEGGTREELGAINAMELIIADERRKAAEEIGRILIDRIKGGFGNIVGEDVENAIKEFCENEVLEISHADRHPKVQYEAEE